MNILNMFKDIEIKNTTRISGEDLEFCELQEKIYNKVCDIYENLSQSIQELRNNEIKELNDKFKWTNGSNHTGTFTNAITYGHHNYDISDNITKISENMISGITSYFSHKYNVQIDYEKIKKLAKDKRIDCNFVVDLIFEQLGGFSFEDKAKQQVIDKLKENTKQYSREKQKVTVKNNKVSIIDYLYADSWNKNELGYHSRERMEILFNAINSFCDNEQDSSYISELYNIKYFGEYDLKFTHCTSTKFYKNGKVDLVFTNGIKALEFANEYTSYAIN
jgi:hypothetical protein